jgi:hypothetical protein
VGVPNTLGAYPTFYHQYLCGWSTGA